MKINWSFLVVLAMLASAPFLIGGPRAKAADLKQNAAFADMAFVAGASNHVDPWGSCAMSWAVSKAGGDFAAASPTVTSKGYGWCALSWGSSYTDTPGVLAIHGDATGADPVDYKHWIRGKNAEDLNPAVAGDAMTLTAAYDAAKTAASAGTWTTTRAAYLDAAISGRASQASVDALADPYPTFTVVSDAGNTVLQFKTNLSESDNNFWKLPAAVRFTSGTLTGQIKYVQSYNGTTKFITLTDALTGIPQAGDTGDIINR